MPYTVIARRWRPQSFDELVGQEHVATTLKNALKAGHQSHAYLFVGPHGVGKTTTARLLAKALNCIKGPTSEPCQKCSFCDEISQGRCLDVFEMDAASNNKVDDIRELRESVRLSPASAKFKVYIIDEVHMLSAGAFNAFLKTLEEPPAHVIFILATTEVHKLPTTILSRCQRFDFKRITNHQIAERLRAICQAEGVETDEACLYQIARFSEGSMRDAQGILDQLISFSQKALHLEDVNALLGLVERETFCQLVEAIHEADMARGLHILDSIVRQGKDLGQFLRQLLLHFRNIMIAKVAEAEALEELLDLPQQEVKAFEEQARLFHLNQLMEIAEELTSLESRFRGLLSERVAVELTFLKLCSMASEVPLESLFEKLAQWESDMAPPAAPSAQDLFEEELPKEEQGQLSVEAIWQNLLSKLKEAGEMALLSLLSRGSVEGIKDGQFLVSFGGMENSFTMESLQRAESLQKIETLLQALSPSITSIKYVKGAWEEAKEEAEDSSQEEKEAEEKNLKLLLRYFPGKLTTHSTFEKKETEE